uniref:Protein kinase domain-containing protein n=1 Tax=Angiostrongylus cantonensis TaxID=6313 RepID=A0A0K0D0N9_ANGCA
LDEQQWFHGMSPREDIDRLLTEDGQFLVRVTEPRPDMVAVKVHKGGTVNKEVIAEICKEARFMRHYRHPNIIKFYGVAVEWVNELFQFVDDFLQSNDAPMDPLMLVMELSTGGALNRLLWKKKDEFSLQDLLMTTLCLFLLARAKQELPVAPK